MMLGRKEGEVIEECVGNLEAHSKETDQRLALVTRTLTSNECGLRSPSDHECSA